MSRYLNEIRLGEEKQFFRDVIRNVRQKFNLPLTSRPVPHITLFGPYNTSQGYEVKNRMQNVLADYRIVPYRVTGFSSFTDAGVVYADVSPSKQLRSLRRDLVSSIKPLTYDCRSWDTDNTYDFHITIASDLGQKREGVLEYVRSEYDVDMDLYAKRVTALDGRGMMWEWDLPRSTELSSREATSKKSWEKTITALESHEGGESSKRSKNLLRRVLPWIS